MHFQAVCPASCAGVEQHALHAMPSSSLREAVYAADAAAGALTSLQPRVSVQWHLWCITIIILLH
jgi:hypothetical protein